MIKIKTKSLFIQFIFMSALYNAALGVWSGTIYIFMQHLGYSYSQINLLLIIFWIITFITELPSGMLSDYLGKINVFMLSCVIRCSGLLLLFFDGGNLSLLIVCALLTGLGDSLFSGTLDSWFVSRVKEIDENYQLNSAFSISSTTSTIASLLTGFIGAQFLANWNLGYPILVGALLLLLPLPIAWRERERYRSNQNEHADVEKLKDRVTINSSRLQTIKTSLSHNRIFLWLSLSFLPITLIVTGPFNQWQLLFQQGNHRIETGWILIGVNICGILGSSLAGVLMKFKHQMSLLIGLVLITSLTTFFAALIQMEILSIIIFLVHVLFTASDEVVRYTILHKNIHGNHRTSLISLNNTFNAGSTLLALALNGWLSDAYSIRIAWMMLSIIGVGMTLIGYAIIYRQHHFNNA